MQDHGIAGVLHYLETAYGVMPDGSEDKESLTGQNSDLDLGGDSAQALDSSDPPRPPSRGSSELPRPPSRCGFSMHSCMSHLQSKSMLAEDATVTKPCDS